MGRRGEKIRVVFDVVIVLAFIACIAYWAGGAR